MVAGANCPECGGSVRNRGGNDYECRECGRTFDSADLFLP